MTIKWCKVDDSQTFLLKNFNNIYIMFGGQRPNLTGISVNKKWNNNRKVRFGLGMYFLNLYETLFARLTLLFIERFGSPMPSFYL